MGHPKNLLDYDIKVVETGETENHSFTKIAQHFMNFCERFAPLFQSKTRSREPQMKQYMSGLIQANKKNMERIAEVVPDSSAQSFQHFLSESEWNEREVIDLVALGSNMLLGNKEDSCLIIDETGILKKGKKSVGVSRQWCGQIGKVDNCQVGVFAALCHGGYATLIDERLFLPESWINDKKRCLAAGVPTDKIVAKRKPELALDIVDHAHQLKLGYNWIGCDGFYGENPAFLRALDARNETFMADVHKNQHIYLEDPRPIVPPQKPEKRGKKPTRLQAQTKSDRVDLWALKQPADAWKRITLRDSTKGELQADILHQRVWLWDGIEPEAHCWHLIVRREVNTPSKLKYSLCNAKKEIPTSRLAFMQGQRYWIEQTLKHGKQEAGLGDYQVRGWRGWHHHMALVMMAMLFMLEERILHQDDIPLLSYSDIRILLNHFLPRRDVTLDEILRQMKCRHQKRQASIDSAYQKQRLQQLGIPDG